MFGRPKFGETDEDILKLQEEFFKQKAENKIQVSTKYVGLSEQRGSTDDNNVLSTKVHDESGSSKDVLSERMVIGEIVERKNVYDMKIEDDIKFKSGFPQAKRRMVSGSQKTGSLFSQNKNLRSPKLIKIEQKIDSNAQPSTSINEFISSKKLHEKIKNLPSKSFIVAGEDKEEIHKQNLDKLQEMSEEEIIEEQKNLLDSLDPNIVQFFKSKRKEEILEPVEEKDERFDFKEDIVEAEEIETAKEIIDKSETWLNFDKVETEKIQWMKDIVIPKKLKNKQEYEARFDFAGWLLPYTDPEITEENRILYHHGNEPGRPGYTLQELFKLCRSNVLQQRILALTTISNILSINSTGVYENIIEIPIEQIFFVVRIALDDNTPSVLNASLKAMHNILWNQIDEICIDSLLGFGFGLIQPILTVESETVDKEDEKELNDQQMVEQDLIKCLMRTDILIRIRYIINVVKPSIETITYCLELLIRLMRDSQTVYSEIYNCEDLFSSIIKHFIPKIYQLYISDSAYNTPIISAIKLIRISACRDKVIAKDLAEKYHILDAITSYISSDIGKNITGVKIQTESLNLLAVYLSYKLKIEYFKNVQPFLIRNLEYHLNNTDISGRSSYVKQSHFSAIVNVVTEAAKINFKLIENFIPLLRSCTSKYCSQISKLTNIKCGHLQIISSLLICIQNKIDVHVFSNDIISLLNSTGLTKVTENIRLGSNLLCDYESLKSSPNLIFSEAVVWKTSEHVVPVLASASSMPFLRALSQIITTCNKDIKIKFLKHPNIIKYIKQLKKSAKFSLTTNWFTKIESHFIMNILKCVVDAQSILDEPVLYFELAVICLSIFGAEMKDDVEYILKNIVFNRKFYPNEMLLQELQIKESEDIVESSLRCLEEIYDCYATLMGLNKKPQKMSKALSLDVRIGNIVPIDWVFIPIVSLYSQQEDKEKIGEEQKCRIIIRCLQWIFLYETYFPLLSSLVNTTDRFCRLCCVFLLSNSLFLEDDVQKLLGCILKKLITKENYEQLDFDKEIQGLSNFQDFYTEFLEHYQGVSYGNSLFANFVLIPLAQRHNTKWRKVLWSEYEGVTQIINITEEQCFLELQEFLEPLETDVSILKCYRRALISGHLNRSPFLKKITTFHMENYVKKKINK